MISLKISVASDSRLRLGQPTLHGEHAGALAEDPRQLAEQLPATHRIASDVVERFAVVDRNVALDRHRVGHVGLLGLAADELAEGVDVVVAVDEPGGMRSRSHAPMVRLSTSRA